MKRISVIRHAFISYAAPNRELATRLAEDLERAGVSVWIDVDGLEPGTPDWEAEVRRVIPASFAVVLVASPSARQSPYVRSELLLAESAGLPVYAVWVEGEEWIDSVPLKFAHVQYQDFRGDAYPKSLAVLVDFLRKRGDALPEHFVYESFYTKISDEHVSAQNGASHYSSDGRTFTAKSRPLHYAQIMVSDEWAQMQEKDSVDTVFVDPAAFQSQAQLLDAIYLAHLSEQYPPFTYGVRWHLRMDNGNGCAAVPWRSVHSDEPAQMQQGLCASPASFGLRAGTRWKVSDGKPDFAIVLGAHDPFLIDALVYEAKAPYSLIEENMEAVDVGAFEAAAMPFVAVLSGLSLFPHDFANRLFVQTKELSAQDRARWRHWKWDS